MLSKLHKGLEEVPLLIKIITAREALSVQVHPEDALAWKLERTRGKTEMWYVIDCEPGAHLYYGLKHRISKEDSKPDLSGGMPKGCGEKGRRLFYSGRPDSCHRKRYNRSGSAAKLGYHLPDIRLQPRGRESSEAGAACR